MPRKTRIEFPGASYHVINRGNYRSWIFESPGARVSFLKCLQQTCEAQGWVLHSWVLMGNHYHLCVSTPEANLVAGMSWLQSTFANRFNRFRRMNGHVFQGRYKAILLDGDAVSAVSHYIHLNPVRAGIVSAEELESYEASSFSQLWNPPTRWSCFESREYLAGAGGLADTVQGRHQYRDYLCWLAETDTERKRLGFTKMSRGWVSGSKEFRKAVLKDLSEQEFGKIVEAEAAPLKAIKWERALQSALQRIGKDGSDLAKDRKGAEWKVALARYLRERVMAPNPWLAERLKMGQTSSVQALVSRHRHVTGSTSVTWRKLNHESLD